MLCRVHATYTYRSKPLCLPVDSLLLTWCIGKSMRDVFHPEWSVCIAELILSPLCRAWVRAMARARTSSVGSS